MFLGPRWDARACAAFGAPAWAAAWKAVLLGPGPEGAAWGALLLGPRLGAWRGIIAMLLGLRPWSVGVDALGVPVLAGCGDDGGGSGRRVRGWPRAAGFFSGPGRDPMCGRGFGGGKQQRRWRGVVGDPCGRGSCPERWGAGVTGVRWCARRVCGAYKKGARWSIDVRVLNKYF